MATTFSSEDSQRNMLPSHYASWLDFYDNLSWHLRDRAQVQVCVEVAGGYQRWLVDREYYLARIAELLLPTRPTEWATQQLSRLLEQSEEGKQHPQQLDLIAILDNLDRTAIRRRPGT